MVSHGTKINSLELYPPVRHQQPSTAPLSWKAVLIRFTIRKASSVGVPTTMCNGGSCGRHHWGWGGVPWDGTLQWNGRVEI